MILIICRGEEPPELGARVQSWVWRGLMMGAEADLNVLFLNA